MLCVVVWCCRYEFAADVASEERQGRQREAYLKCVPRAVLCSPLVVGVLSVSQPVTHPPPSVLCSVCFAPPGT